jgi:hypothetical protein
LPGLCNPTISPSCWLLSFTILQKKYSTTDAEQPDSGGDGVQKKKKVLQGVQAYGVVQEYDFYGSRKP